MICVDLELEGVKLITHDVHADDRGSFSRLFCLESLERIGLPGRWPQGNMSMNLRRGTMRGMHLQRPPYAEEKLVRCMHGRMLDVVVDVREDSPTYLRHLQIELCSGDGKTLYVPRGFAHGFLTLADNTSIFYLMGGTYQPESAMGLRWDDPALSIDWPEEIQVISSQDQSWPDWDSSRAY